jgi:hypothetical protein
LAPHRRCRGPLADGSAGLARGGPVTNQDLYLGGHKQDAAAKIPTELIERLSLIGPPDKIRHDLEPWRESIVTTILVSGDAATLRTAAELVLG